MGGGEQTLWPGPLERLRCHAAAGSRASLARDGEALRLDYELADTRAFAIARCGWDAELPPYFAVRLTLRGNDASSELQLKLVDDASGSVWWWRVPEPGLGLEATSWVLRLPRLSLAWGPSRDEVPRRIAAVEIGVQANAPTRGRLWIDEWILEPRDPGATALLPLALARAGAFSFEADLGRACEIGGVLLEPRAGAAGGWQLLGSSDGEHWSSLAEGLCETRTPLWLRAEADARFLRLVGPAASDSPDARLVPLALAAAPARYARVRARAAPRGALPRHLLGESADWTLVAGDGRPEKCLLSEDGAVELDGMSLSVEPSLWVEGKRLGWADATGASVSLADGCLPIPSARLELGGLSLETTAAAGPGDGPVVLRFALANADERPRRVRLVLALRPFGVTPEWQALGGSLAAPAVHSISVVDGEIRVNGEPLLRIVSPADGFRVLDSEETLAALAARPSAATGAPRRDPLGFASAELHYEMRLGPHARESVALAGRTSAAETRPASTTRAAASTWADEALTRAAAHWRARLARIPIDPPAPWADALRASVGWLLALRDGPRLLPGARAYRRVWMRDGAFMAGALLEMGYADEARAFARWYAGHQRPDGSVPCAIDARGADPVAEHDSHGQLIWTIVEIFRHTRDQTFLAELWPHVARAADAILALRAEHAASLPAGDPRQGLLPASISHEGYSAGPVHAYWDDFFAVRGLADAAEAARALGEPGADRLEAAHQAMRADLRASIARTVELRQLDYVPGSLELADLDPSATAAAFDPCGVESALPPEPLARTLERAWQEIEASGQESWSPYRMRLATAFLRSGQPERSLATLARALEDQRPRGWRQWPEVCFREPRTARFLGDLPHGWIAATFVRALRRHLVDERPDGSLHLASAVAPEWLERGVRVRQISTHYGVLSFSARRAGAGRVRFDFAGSLSPPPRGVCVAAPLASTLRSAVADGAPVPCAGNKVVLPRLPLELLLTIGD